MCVCAPSFDQRTHSGSSQPPLTLTECEEMMLDLQEKYPVEYKTYGLSSVAVAIVFPLIQKYLQVKLHKWFTVYPTAIITSLARCRSVP